MRVLIVRITSMGDVVLTLPVVNDMLRHIPGIQIDWMVEKPFAAIPMLHPGISRIVSVQWRKWRKTLHTPATRQALRAFRADLRAVHYDAVIDFQGQVAKSVLLGKMAHGPLWGFAWQGLREPLSSLFYRRKGQVSRRLHLVPRSRALAANLLGYPEPHSAPDYGIVAPPAQWQAPVSAPAGYAVLIPNASRPEKLWPQQRWIAVGKQLAARGLAVTVLWGSQSELQLAQQIADALGANVPPFLSVAQVAALLGGAQVVVGLDTGFTHLAVALQRPTIGIYCDFDPALAGLVGSAFTASLGGVGQVPSLESVLQALTESFGAAPVPALHSPVRS